jgi:hypothetical protein
MSAAISGAAGGGGIAGTGGRGSNGAAIGIEAGAAVRDGVRENSSGAGVPCDRGGGRLGRVVRFGFGSGGAALLIGGIVIVRTGAVLTRTCGNSGMFGALWLPAAERWRGSGATSPAAWIGGTADVTREGELGLFGFGAGAANIRSSAGFDLSGVDVCTSSINALTAVDSVFAMDAKDCELGSRCKAKSSECPHRAITNPMKYH